MRKANRFHTVVIWFCSESHDVFEELISAYESHQIQCSQGSEATHFTQEIYAEDFNPEGC